MRWILILAAMGGLFYLLNQVVTAYN